LQQSSQTAFLASFVTSVVAADEQTIKARRFAPSANCHETEKCQTAIRVKEDGKDVIYYAVNNDVAKKFHKTVCQSTAKVTATGTVKERTARR